MSLPPLCPSTPTFAKYFPWESGEELVSFMKYCKQRGSGGEERRDWMLCLLCNVSITCPHFTVFFCFVSPDYYCWGKTIFSTKHSNNLCCEVLWAKDKLLSHQNLFLLRIWYYDGLSSLGKEKSYLWHLRKIFLSILICFFMWLI